MFFNVSGIKQGNSRSHGPAENYEGHKARKKKQHQKENKEGGTIIELKVSFLGSFFLNNKNGPVEVEKQATNANNKSIKGDS